MTYYVKGLFILSIIHIFSPFSPERAESVFTEKLRFSVLDIRDSSFHH